MTMSKFQRQLDILLAEDVDRFVDVQAVKINSQLKQKGEAFVLFGAGRLGLITLEGLRKAGVEPLAFTDNSSNLWGQTLEGVKIFSPQEAKQKFGDRALFVITVYTSTPVRHQLKELDVDFVSFAELSWKYPQSLLPHYATDLPYSIFSEAQDVSKGLAIWADDASQREYLAQIAWRTSLDPNVLPASHHPQEIYFQPDLFSFLPSDILVDCGAFDGDTIRELARRMIDYRQLIAIEPDPLNYKNLETYLSTLPDNLSNKISIYKNAVGSIREKIKFKPTGTAGTIMHTGMYEVESIPLDEMLAHIKPDYIKMDIEGAELAALSGGRKIIEKYHPILAICLYHHQTDLWRIPLLIRELSDQYRLYLRRYSDECWEQVCYAVPEERAMR